jgi:hypothetical protein
MWGAGAWLKIVRGYVKEKLGVSYGTTTYNSKKSYQN